MKVTVLFMLAFLGIASAGKLGHHHGHDIPSFSQDSGTASSFGNRQSTLFEHSSGQGLPGPNQFGRVSEPSVHTSKSLIELDVRIEGIVKFDNHHGIFRGGVLQGFGEKLAIGEIGHCTIQGTGIFDDGQTSSLEEGLLIVRKISITDRQALQTALSHTGVTVDQFIQQTENIALQHCAYEIISGTIIVDGVPNNIIAGVYIISSVGVNDDKPITGSGVGSGDFVQTVTVTETAAFQTQIITEAVTLTKRQTIDTFVTVTAPNYASILVTVTNIVKQTGTVSEEEVIRSPVAGALIVNTVPVSSITVVNVRARTTNYFVQTVTEQVSLPQTHFVTIHSLSTITVNNPVKSTVVQAITQTQVLTVTKTSIVNRTVYTTGTTTITIGSGGGTHQTTTPPGGYY